MNYKDMKFGDKVRDHIPLEQGLRPGSLYSIQLAANGQRPYSIRTRIKTIYGSDGSVVRRRQRPYSIRTRIKTTSIRLKSFLTLSETIFH